MNKRAWLTMLLLGTLVIATPLRALAANPTYYPSRAAFIAALKPAQTIVDDYSNPGYMNFMNDVSMTAVLNQTHYTTTGFQNNDIVQQAGTPNADYCAGCNGSFRLTFTATSVGTANGVFGAGVDIPSNMGYYAYVTFGDNTTANIQLVTSFFAVSAPELIKSIHFGLSGGMSTQGGYFEIDNLTIGAPAVPPPPCMVDADCDDLNPCNGVETCDPVGLTCIFPSPLDCDDKNDCTKDSCDPMMGCVHVTVAGSCDDGDACTSNDICNNGVCQGSPIDCDDAVACTDDACDPMIGCTHTNLPGPCDDNDACTMNDACSNGQCTGTPVSCDDNNPCTDDACSPATGCTHVPNTDPCDDGSVCTMNDACSAGKCTGVAIDCDDKDACTTDSCDAALGCRHVPDESCMGCMVNGQTVSCDDHDVCTADSCGASGCVHAKVLGCCHDDTDCNQDEGCDPGTNVCVQTAIPAEHGGCSCRAPGEAPSSNGAWAAVFALAAAAVVRRGRRVRL